MSIPGEVGTYRGVKYHRKRICDVLAVDIRARWWFPLEEDGKYYGDHFATKRELFAWIDQLSTRRASP